MARKCTTINVYDVGYTKVVVTPRAIAAPKGPAKIETTEHTKLECMICTEAIGRDRRTRVICPYCPDTTATVACSTCVRTYILGLVKPAECMFCKRPWSTSVLVKILPKSFAFGQYRKHVQKIYLDREKARLPESMGLVAEFVERKKLKAQMSALISERGRLNLEIQKLRIMIRMLRERGTAKDKKKAKVLAQQRTVMKQQVYVIRAAIDELHHQRFAIGRNEYATPSKAMYMLPCPAEGCRGFIEKETKECGLCKTKICRSCHAIKSKGDGHTCDPNDVETAKAILKETRACPSCATRIFRIEGCDQMFCTGCHTAFSWNTGAIVTKGIHNPHYFELQATLGRALRAPGDVPCGGVPIAPGFFYEIENARWGGGTGPALRWLTAAEPALITIVVLIERRAREIGELLDQIAQPRDDTLSHIRVRFLANDIDERTFTRLIFAHERDNERRQINAAVFETFRTTAIERLRALYETIPTEMQTIYEKMAHATQTSTETKLFRRICATQIKDFARQTIQIMNMCNEAFASSYRLLGFTAHPKIAIDSPVYLAPSKHQREAADTRDACLIYAAGLSKMLLPLKKRA